MRVLLWHVHGGYTDSLVQGGHEYLFLVADDPSCHGMGSPGIPWPASARDLTRDELARHPPDVVLVQRLEEIALCERLLGWVLGRDVPAIFLEHNTPRTDIPQTRHPLADRPGWLIVHVTHFNAVFWDCAATPTRVIEHGIIDPGLRYRGDLPHQAFVVNEPVRRWRVTGTDLLPGFARRPVDAFGIDGHLLPAALGPKSGEVRFTGNLPPEQLYDALAERRVYLHLNRWTSLGLSLLQAMHLGLPVVVLGTTEAYRAVPPEAGAVSTDPGELVRAAHRLLDDPDHAAACGRVARQAALQRYGLRRFLADWDDALTTAQRS